MGKNMENEMETRDYGVFMLLSYGLLVMCRGGRILNHKSLTLDPKPLTRTVLETIP